MKKLSTRQVEAISRLTGHFARGFHPEALKAFFAYTDRGESLPVSVEAEKDYEYLMGQHKHREVQEGMWITGFYEGTLYIQEFLEEHRRKGLPLSYLLRVFECCKRGVGFVPLLYYAPSKDWEECRYDVERFSPCYRLMFFRYSLAYSAVVRGRW